MSQQLSYGRLLLMEDGHVQTLQRSCIGWAVCHSSSISYLLSLTGKTALFTCKHTKCESWNAYLGIHSSLSSMNTTAHPILLHVTPLQSLHVILASGWTVTGTWEVRRRKCGSIIPEGRATMDLLRCINLWCLRSAGVVEGTDMLWRWYCSRARATATRWWTST